MKLRNCLRAIAAQEDLNFLLTNRIPRRWATRFMGWFSRIETPPVPWISIRLWRLFSDVDLSDAADTRYRSLHAAFTRRLRDGARSIAPDPATLASPCDAIVGACGAVDGTQVFQAKGFPYALRDLLHDDDLCTHYRDGSYVTLRLTAGMYHRFHAPHDARLDGITYISGDTWNVNPIALQRIERLFCRNERVVIPLRVGGVEGAVGFEAGGDLVTLVPVAAILVASVRLHCLPQPLNLGYRGPNRIPCRAMLRKGEEMGYFEHGSTIIVFAPRGYRLADGVSTGMRIAQGAPLLVRSPDDQ